MNKKIKIALILFSVLAISFIVYHQLSNRIKNGNELIYKMHQRYQGQWYRNLTFRQKTIFYKDNQVLREERWYEAMQMPTGLIIKFGDKTGDNGILFKNDTMTVFKNGNIANQIRRVHELLVLGFSVYFDRPEATIAKLKEAGFNLDHLGVDNIDGKNYFVVGDPLKKQFWIRASDFLFSKVETHHADGSKSSTEFKDYRKLKGGWIAPTVNFYKDGNLIMKEKYFEIEVPKKFSEDLFESNRFSNIKW